MPRRAAPTAGVNARHGCTPLNCKPDQGRYPASMAPQPPELAVHLPAVDAVHRRITPSCVPSVPHEGASTRHAYLGSGRPGAYWSGRDGQRCEAHCDQVACSGGTGGI
jgi:hypothetical protein